MAPLWDLLIQKPQAAAKAKEEIMKVVASAAVQQVDLNKVEAQHSSLFVAGWRPFLGWVCGIALLYAFILSPLLGYGAALMGYSITLPVLPMEYLTELVASMLGLAGLRTFEKVRKVPPSRPVTAKEENDANLGLF